MITYLINFVLCSGVLLLVYRVFLQNEKLYRFNRFYLLFSLVFSLAVPLVTIQLSAIQLPAFVQTVVNQNPPVINEMAQPQITTPVIWDDNANNTQPGMVNKSVQQNANAAIQQAVQSPKSAYNYLPLILISLYLIAALVMLLRFIRNSYLISRTIKQNVIVDDDETSLVLLEDDVTPHSFLKYIFLNKADYDNGRVEPEIICHEQAHVKQLHSLDVILVEILQAVCWFNPLIPFYRKAIQLNHEFLADEAVVKSYDNTPAYLYLLLTKASQCGSLYLTSQFNYLTTKKRLIMMTKTTSAKIALLKQLTIVPVLAAALILFCHKGVAKTEPKKAEKTAVLTDNRKRMVFATFNAKPGAKMHLNSKAPITMIFETKAIGAAKSDASQNVLNEYAAILKRNNIPYKAGDKVNYKPQFTDADRAKIETLYGQMSRKQQMHQYIKVWRPAPPIAKFYATERELTDWQDATQYGVWLDGKLINNAELSKYKVADFDYALAYPLPAKLASHAKFNNQVQLMTKAFYAKYCNEVLAKENLLMYNPKKDWKFDSEGMVETEDEANTGSADVPQRTPQQNKTVVAKTTAPPDFVFITKPVPPAKNDAPQNVMDEYDAILEKYKQTDPTSLTPHRKFSDADRDRLETLYRQMSDDQQRREWLWFVPRSTLVINKTPPPTDKQLNTWQDAATYGVWVNDKRIKNTELSKYKPADFDYVGYSRLMPIAVKNDGFHYQVDLMTKDYLTNNNKMELTRKDWKIVHNGRGPVKDYYRKF